VFIIYVGCFEGDMKMRNSVSTAGLIFILFAVPLLFVSTSVQNVNAQTDRLTLAAVLTGLQSKSGGLTLGQKNTYITQRVIERGVTFRISTEITNELRRAGASVALINAIRANGPQETTTTTNTGNASNVEFDRLWVTYNVTEKGQKGMRVHTKFTVRSMKDVPLFLTYRFQKEDGDTLSSDNEAFRNAGGQLAVFRKLTPAYNAAVYKDYSIFVPYKEIVLPPGKHNLKVDADIIYENGDILKHLKLHPFLFTQPAKSTTAPRVKFTRMWIDHNVTQGGLRGMRVHTNMTVYNLLNKASSLAVAVAKRDKTKVLGKTAKFKSKNGQLTVYQRFTPKYPAAHFKDIKVFIPYNEFNAVGLTTEFKIHADILYPNSGNLHVTYHDFAVPARTGTTTAAPSVTFTRMWVVHNQRQGGVLGMKVHTNMTVRNLKGQSVRMRLQVQRRNGSRVLGKRAAYRSTTGQLTAVRALRPGFVNAVYKDFVMFIPYREFDVPRGTSTFRIHADLLYPTNKNLHVTYHNFTKRIN
jgi:hypothetical protein